MAHAPPRETKKQKAERLKCEAENPELKEKWYWGYKITNEKLRKICGAAPIGTLAEKFHLKYIAHVTRMSNSALQKQMIYCEAPRPQRRGQMNFWTKMKKATGIETEQLQKTMYNRNDFNKWMRDRYGFAPRPAKSGTVLNTSIDRTYIENFGCSQLKTFFPFKETIIIILTLLAGEAGSHFHLPLTL